MFFASSDRFGALDRRVFVRARTLERELKRHAKSGRTLAGLLACGV